MVTILPGVQKVLKSNQAESTFLFLFSLFFSFLLVFFLVIAVLFYVFLYSVFCLFFGIFDYATLKHHISAVIYSTLSSYTSLERTKIKLSEKKYFGLRKLIIFRTKEKKGKF